MDVGWWWCDGCCPWEIEPPPVCEWWDCVEAPLLFLTVNAADVLRFLSLTCRSKAVITSTAIFSTPSFVCGLSLLPTLSTFNFRASGFKLIHTLPSSVRASFISRILIRSLVLLELRLSLSLTSLTPGSKCWSVTFLRFPLPPPCPPIIKRNIMWNNRIVTEKFQIS